MAMLPLPPRKKTVGGKRVSVLRELSDAGYKARVVSDGVYQIRVPKPLLEEWRAAAKEEGLTLAEFIRKTMDERVHPFGRE